MNADMEMKFKKKKRKCVFISLSRCKTTFEFVLMGTCSQSHKLYFLNINSAAFSVQEFFDVFKNIHSIEQ